MSIDPMTDDELLAALTEERLRFRRADIAAREIIDAKPFGRLEIVTAKELCAEELPEDQWTVDGIMAVGHNVVLAGQYKAGKTALLLNLVRSLADDRPFLDRFGTALDGNILYMNYEMTKGDLQRRLMKQRIRRKSHILIANLRGRPNPLATPDGRDQLVRVCLRNNVQMLVIDTFRAAYYGDSHNDNAEVGKFTRVLDEIKQLGEVQGLILSHHFGRKDHEAGQEHGQGAVELDNWTDMRWLITRGGDEDSRDQRHLAVEGRGDGLRESLMEFDPEADRLTMPGSYVGRGRSKAETLSVQDRIGEALDANPEGMISTAIKEVVGGRKESVSRALRVMVGDGRARAETRGRAIVYFPVNSQDRVIDFE